MRRRIDHGGVDGQDRVEEVREPDAVRFRDQAEARTVAVEAPRPARRDNFEARLVVTVDQLVGDLPGGRLVGEFQRFRAEPLHADDRYRGIRENAADGGVGLEVFESGRDGWRFHCWCPPVSSADVTSVFLKSLPLYSRGSPVTLASA